MKKTGLLVVALVSALCSNAQTKHTFRRATQSHNDRSIMNALLHHQHDAGLQKPTGIKQRVIAQVFSNDGTSDSFHLKYSGSRGSRYNYNTNDFGYNIYTVSSYAPMFVWPGETSAFDVLADSLSYLGNDTLYSIVHNYYRADNKVDSVEEVSGSGLNKKKHTFYPGGQLKTVAMFNSDDSIIFTQSGLRKLTYNTAFTEEVTDSLFYDMGSGLAPFQAYTYHHNTQGTTDSITSFLTNGAVLMPYSRFGITYNAAGKVTRMKTYTDFEGNGIYSLSDIDLLVYANNSDYYTQWDHTYFDETGVVQGGDRTIRYPGANGLPDSTVLFYLEPMSGWQHDLKVSFAYNSFGNPTQLTGSLNGMPQGMMKFYYEEYDDGLSVAEITDQKNFRVYPNPFSNKLSIDWTGKAQSAVDLRVINIVGREVYHTTLKLNPGVHTLDLPAMSDGNYILQLRDGSGKTWSTKLTKK